MNDNRQAAEPRPAGEPPLASQGLPSELVPYQVPGTTPIPLQPYGAGMSAYWHAFRRRWVLVVGLGICCAGLAVPAAWVSQAPTYTATALLRIAAGEERLVFPTADQALREDYELYRGTQQQLLTSDFVLLAALQEPEIAGLEVLKEQLDPVRWLADELHVGVPEGSEIVRVQLSGEDPVAVKNLVNAVVDAYMKKVVNAEKEQRLVRLDELGRVYEDKEMEMRAKRSDLKQLAEELGTGDSGTLALKQQITLQQFGEHRKELVRIRFERRRLEGELKAKQAILAKAGQNEVAPVELDAVARTDPASVDLMGKRDGLEALVAAMGQAVQPEAGSRYVEKYQAALEMVELQLASRREELREELRYRIRQALKSEIAQLQTQVAIATEQEQQFEQDLQGIQQRVEQIGGSSIDVEMMRAEIAHLEAVLSPIAEERERLKVEQGRSGNRIKVIQRAEDPRAPDQTRRLQLTVLAGMAGLCLPGVVIVFWDLRGKRINTSEEVSEGLGMAVLGNVPVVPPRAFQGRQGGSRRQQHWRALLTEAVNGVVVRLLREARDEPLQVLLVSSATSGEGKTTLATQIAMSLARSGRRTLLVDFDLRRPALDRVFEVSLEPGISELLLGSAGLDDIVEDTAIDNLSLITAGGWLDEGLQVLSSDAVEAVFTKLRAEYQFVVIDGSPILPVADARLVAQHADAVILSVLRDVSQAPKVQAAWRILHALGVTSIGSVVTGTSEEVYYKNLSYAARVPA